MVQYKNAADIIVVYDEGSEQMSRLEGEGWKCCVTCFDFYYNFREVLNSLTFLQCIVIIAYHNSTS